MRAALRRSGFATDTAPQKISVPGLEVDFANRKVVANGNVVRLTPTEFDILRYSRFAGQQARTPQASPAGHLGPSMATRSNTCVCLSTTCVRRSNPLAPNRYSSQPSLASVIVLSCRISLCQRTQQASRSQPQLRTAPLSSGSVIAAVGGEYSKYIMGEIPPISEAAATQPEIPTSCTSVSVR